MTSTSSAELLRKIPSVTQLIETDMLRELAGRVGQSVVVGQVRRQVVDGLDDGLEGLLLAPELLSPLGLVPHARVLERGVDFVQPQRLAVVVKDTPEAARYGRSGRRAASRWR